MAINRMILILLAVVVTLLTGCQNAGTPAEKKETGKVKVLHTNGSTLIDPEGNPIILKGTNLGNWLVPEGYMFKMGQVNSPRKIDELLYELIGPDSLTAFWDRYLENYIRHEDIAYLKQIGCNHIRLPFHYKLFTDDRYMGKRNAGFTWFDRVVEWCKEENLYVLLDMHCAPGGQTGDNIDDSYGYPYLFKSESSQDMLVEIWVNIASRYKDEPTIIGYDIINEPVAHYFTDELDTLNQVLFSIYRRVVKEIRQVDPHHAIFLNGSVWSTSFDVFSELPGENIVYEFHKYWFDVNQEAIQTYLDFREEHQVPVYIGETGENTDEWVAQFRTLLDEHQIGWCFWPYKKMNNTRGIMNFEEPEDYHLISEYAASDRSTYENIRKNRLDIVRVQNALNQFLENSLFEHCFPNTGYVGALGFEGEW